MQVEVIFRQANGTEQILGIRKLDSMPPTGEPFSMGERVYKAGGYFGPDEQGCYRLILVDEEISKH